MRAESESMLGANLPREFVDFFWGHAAPKGVKINHKEITEAMATAWLDMDDSVRFYYLGKGSKGSGDFRDFVRQIVKTEVRATLKREREAGKIEDCDESALNDVAEDAQEEKKRRSGHNRGVPQQSG